MTTTSTPVFLMSPPRLDWRLAGRANFRSRQAQSADGRRARREWTRLADTVVAAGAEVVVCPPNPEHNLTGMIYTAEAGEFYRDADGSSTFLLPNMAAAHRRREADWIGRWAAETMGWQTRRVQARWEAQGDAIRTADADAIVHTWGQGPDGRTAKAAYAEVADRLSRRHLHLRFRAKPWFHGNTFLNVYRGQDTALAVVCPEAMVEAQYAKLRRFLSDDANLHHHEIRVHEISTDQSLGYDTNALQVGATVVAPASLSAPTESAMADVGLDIERRDLAELFVKGGGAPVCLTNRLWGVDAAQIPDELCWSTRPHIAEHTNV